MIIDINLSQSSIRNAIRKLEKAKENLEGGLEEVIDVLTLEGAAVANSDYGSMASATGVADGNTGKISVPGTHRAYIAEFGAGDATLDPGVFFSNGGALSNVVFPGAYSLFVSSPIHEYYDFGSWRLPYSYVWYTEVPPRHGLFNAKLFIQQKSTDYAREMIRLD